MDELIQSAGAAAEFTRLMFNNFIRVGFNDYQALELTKEALKLLLQPKGKGE
jgi:hypothetical protein